MPEVAAIERAAERAIEAVRQREEVEGQRYEQLVRRLWIVGIIVSVLVVSLMTLQTLYLRDLSNRNNTTAISARQAVAGVAALTREIAQRAEAEADDNQHLLCQLSVFAKVQLTYTRRVFSRFGAHLPPLPVVGPQTCDLGVDPVFIGTPAGDTMHGTDEVDWMNGEGGNDVISAKGAGDTLVGEQGNDELIGGDGLDHEYGGEGNDVLRSANADGEKDLLDGGPGNDRCYARGSDVTRNCEQVIKKAG